MVDDDLRGEGAAHGPVGVGLLQGILDALDVGYTAVIEGGAEGHHQQLLLADLVLVAGIVLGGVAGVQTEVLRAGLLTLYQRLLGVGQGIPSGLGGLALGVGLLGALLHIDGVDQGGDLIGGGLVGLLGVHIVVVSVIVVGSIVLVAAGGQHAHQHHSRHQKGKCFLHGGSTSFQIICSERNIKAAVSHTAALGASYYIYIRAVTRSGS